MKDGTLNTGCNRQPIGLTVQFLLAIKNNNCASEASGIIMTAATAITGRNIVLYPDAAALKEASLGFCTALRLPPDAINAIELGTQNGISALYTLIMSSSVGTPRLREGIAGAVNEAHRQVFSTAHPVPAPFLRAIPGENKPKTPPWARGAWS